MWQATRPGQIDVNIRLDPDGLYKVRMKRAGQEYFNELPTLESARAWRDGIDRQHAVYRNGLRRSPTPGKQTALPAGLSRAVKKDARREGDARYVVFSVNWKDASGHGRVTTFTAGNIETMTTGQERHAERTAIAFRAAYEWCVDNQRRFRREWFSQWKTLRCYPFTPPSDQAYVAVEQAVAHPPATADQLHRALAEAFGWHIDPR